jgi:hypothetical protein
LHGPIDHLHSILKVDDAAMEVAVDLPLKVDL